MVGTYLFLILPQPAPVKFLPRAETNLFCTIECTNVSCRGRRGDSRRGGFVIEMNHEIHFFRSCLVPNQGCHMHVKKCQCPERASVKRGRGGAGKGGFRLLLLLVRLEAGGMALLALLACMMGRIFEFTL